MNYFDFSKEEIKEILISTFAIAIIFAWPLSFDQSGVISLIIALIAVGTGFIFHELGHRTVAKHYGAWSEYRAWYEGLAIAMILRVILGITFIAPGAVYISKDYLTYEENGKISIVGPLINFGLAFIFLIPMVLSVSMNNIYLWTLGSAGFLVNITLAWFNMLPIPPFDGSKVLSWNKGIWLGVFAVFTVFWLFNSAIRTLIINIFL
ncbi:site-2 protease family protein [Methanococcus voltae]|uniref:Peptidase M50 n=1 Tax=Methanococcus voltae (strain ATCC BAA-1334 / A3) TaxID=456320 RepID=D7DUM9_METV3|nr:site-2 protease family protein [Methanococcus voltae]MCS3900641.1 Zn-dependent protease [Methanococcus voltae]